jgi:hypothetical protein
MRANCGRWGSFEPDHGASQAGQIHQNASTNASRRRLQDSRPGWSRCLGSRASSPKSRRSSAILRVSEFSVTAASHHTESSSSSFEISFPGLPSRISSTRNFVDKFEPKYQALIRATRRALQKRLPTANELAYDNYNFFALGYCSSERPSDCIVSIAAGANGVGLSFYHGATLPDPHRILLGSGNQNRFIRIELAEMLGRPEVGALISAATAQTKTPLPASGGGKLIIRSISVKQRPRR